MDSIGQPNRHYNYLLGKNYVLIDKQVCFCKTKYLSTFKDVPAKCVDALSTYINRKYRDRKHYFYFIVRK